MANTITKTKLLESSRKAIFHIYFEADGSGELVNEVIIDPQADFEIPYDPQGQLSIMQIWYGQAVYDTVLKFNALVPTPVWTMVADAETYNSFEYFGGLKDMSGVEHDGKILISTNGFATAGSNGTLIIELKKD